MYAAPLNDEEQLNLLDFEFPKDLGFPKDFPWFIVYECYFNLLDRVSKAYGMEKVWPQYQPKMQARLDDWRECLESGEESAVYAYVYQTFRSLSPLILCFFQHEFQLQ